MTRASESDGTVAERMPSPFQSRTWWAPVMFGQIDRLPKLGVGC